MSTKLPTTVYRQDYQPYPFDLPKVELHFTLSPEKATVQSQLHFRAKDKQAHDLVLNGEDIELVSLALNGKALFANDYQLEDNQLILPQMQGDFILEIGTSTKPETNKTLMGLYVSGGNFFTQCEAEGFRRITFYPDRPDVMSQFTVSIEADKKTYPYLLSNGNLTHSEDLANNRHKVIWSDPFRKPAYLFALVAGSFDIKEKTVKTASGKEVLLQIFSDKGSGEQTLWALECLENALRWDETRFGLELDLNRFMVVAARDFNMGAMENKGLNIFNAAYVLADFNSSTDTNFAGIEAVIGHEYFHNWTGNRVTCQDWFQLSLKEGLTVFRDQEFSADMMTRGLSGNAERSARTVKRIEDVTTLRIAQFTEDAGPMAHPIRPNSYQEIGNFYTATVYEKGAEVIRMQHTLLGEESFQIGMKEYFRRHDGQAVTCDHFIDAMEWAYQLKHPEQNWDVFRHWYSQAGTPTVTVQLDYDASTHQAVLVLSQDCPKVGVEKLDANWVKPPLHIPFKIGFLDGQGNPLTFSVQGSSTVVDETLLELKQAQQQWVIENLSTRPIPSLLRDFSAPVNLDYPYQANELAILAAHDSNYFARWQAVQLLANQEILHLAKQVQQNGQASIDASFINPILLDVWQNNLMDKQLDPAYRCTLLTLPSARILLDQMQAIDPQSLIQAINQLKTVLAQKFESLWLNILEANQTPGEYSPDPINAGKRSLKNLALNMLMSVDTQIAQQTALTQFEQADNMTDRMGALSAIVNYAPSNTIEQCLNDFYETWKHDPLVIDKWFTLQANSQKNDLTKITQLMAHPAFDMQNPNRARSLIFQFCMNNLRAFHRTDGQGYEYWADQVLAINPFNPEVAARLARVMDNWASYAQPYKDLMKQALQRVADTPNLSPNVSEIVSKALSI